jgi:type VI secretion system protein ImpF
MVILRNQDRLQPALLDRLTDDDPSSQVESTDARAINRSRLRELILRDLSWLFNASRPSDDIDAAALPHAARSVITYGLPALSGQSLSGVNLNVLQQRVHQAIVDHEPRILAETLHVEALHNDEQADHHNQIGFRISGQMWAQPVPLELLLHTNIDLETGRVEIREAAA